MEGTGESNLNAEVIQYMSHRILHLFIRKDGAMRNLNISSSPLPVHFTWPQTDMPHFSLLGVFFTLWLSLALCQRTITIFSVPTKGPDTGTLLNS